MFVVTPLQLLEVTFGDQCLFLLYIFMFHYIIPALGKRKLYADRKARVQCCSNITCCCAVNQIGLVLKVEELKLHMFSFVAPNFAFVQSIPDVKNSIQMIL